MRKINEMTVNRERICLAAIVLLSVCVCILSCQLYAVNAKKVSGIEPILVSGDANSVDMHGATAPVFYISVQDGSVRAQDLTEENAWILLKNIDIRTMRNADRDRFETGFYLYSEEELMKLLEDYSS